MQTLLLGVAASLLLCCGIVSVFAGDEITTRTTIFEAKTNIKLSKIPNHEHYEFVHSYRYPTLEEVQGVMVAFAEARYESHLTQRAGEVVAKYSTNQGNTWNTIVVIPRKTTQKFARAVNPTIVKHNKSLLIFAERFEDSIEDWSDYKRGNSDFVRSLLNGVTNGNGDHTKTAITVSHPVSLLSQLSNGIQHFQMPRLLGGFRRGIEVNQTSIVPVWFWKNTKKAYSTILLFGSSNWKLAQGTGDEGTLESTIAE